MKYIQKPKQEYTNKTYEFELKSPNSNNYSLSVLIQKEVINKLHLKKGDKLEIQIQEFDDKIGYDIRFKQSGTSKKNIIPIDDIDKKENEKQGEQNSASNTIENNNDSTHDKNIYSNSNFEIKINSKKKTKQLLIYTKSDNTLMTRLGITNKSDAEIIEIIDKLILCESETEIKNTLNEYRP